MAEESHYQSLTSCYSKVYPCLKARIVSIVNDSHIAEDILQEAILRGIQKLGSEHIRSPNAWLSRVAFNLAIDYCRERKHLSLREEEALAPSRLESITTAPYSELIRGKLSQQIDLLPPRHREVIQYHYMEGISFKDIGNRLRISEGSAKQLAYQARRSLSRTL